MTNAPPRSTTFARRPFRRREAWVKTARALALGAVVVATWGCQPAQQDGYDEELLEQEATVAPAWKVNTSYAAKSVVTYNGAHYECLVAHRSAVGKEPENATTLWRKLVVREWSAGTNYKKGAPVRFGGVLYECIKDHKSVRGQDPSRALSLWQRPTPPDGLDWQVQTHYLVASKVKHDGILYESVKDHVSVVGQSPPKAISVWRRPTPQEIVDWQPQTHYRKGSGAIFQGSRYECRQEHVSVVGQPPTKATALWRCASKACGGGKCTGLADGSLCDDGNACTRSDTCRAGACAGTNPVTCAAIDQCHDVGVCDPASGLCSSPRKPDGASCSDGNACTTGDTCQAGVCAAGAGCNDGNPCTTDSCDAMTGCRHETTDACVLPTDGGSSVAAGTKLRISWAGLSEPYTDAWVGLFPKGAPDSADPLSVTPTGGGASGSMDVTVFGDTPPGDYELRLFRARTGERERLAASDLISVTAWVCDPEIYYCNTLTVLPGRAAPGQTVHVMWSGFIRASARSWIGLSYVGGSDVVRRQTIGAITDGAVDFTLPDGLAPGPMIFRLYVDEGIDVVAHSNVLTVLRPRSGLPPVPPDLCEADGCLVSTDAIVFRGRELVATWSGLARPSGADWIGVYKRGSAGGAFSWAYTGGGGAGSIRIPIDRDVPTGTYELRMFYDNSFSKIATSNEFTMFPNPVPCNGDDCDIELIVAPLPAKSGDVVRVGWSLVSSPTARDWIGLFKPGADRYYAFQFTDGAERGSMEFTLPSLADGKYSFRYFRDNSAQFVASGSLTIQNDCDPDVQSCPVRRSTIARPEALQVNAPAGGCSGVLIAPQYVLTAAHCLHYRSEFEGGSVVIRDASGQVQPPLPVDRMWSFEPVRDNGGDTDVALVRLRDPVPPSLATPAAISDRWPNEGEPVTVIGYCSGTKESVTFDWSDGQGVCGGDSGGPVFRGRVQDNGEVTALVSGREFGTSVWGCAVRMRERIDATIRALEGNEAGWDRFGSDLRAFAVDDEAQCRQECAKEPACKAYSYTVGEKDCYLKRAVARAIPSANVNSGLPAPYSRFDRPGGDIGGETMSSTDRCQVLCAKDPRCSAWTFDEDSKECRTKGFPTPPADDQSCPTCVSGERRGFEARIARRGGNYKSMTISNGNPGACAEACAKEDSCRAFAWYEDKKGCFLKKYVPDPDPSEDFIATSGVRRGLEWGQDRPGHDFDTIFYLDWPEQCQAACARNARCKAWSYKRWESADGPLKRCLLKDQIPEASPVLGAVSGRRHLEFF